VAECVLTTLNRPVTLKPPREAVRLYATLYLTGSTTDRKTAAQRRQRRSRWLSVLCAVCVLRVYDVYVTKLA
jgi:hypothetical protein